MTIKQRKTIQVTIPFVVLLLQSCSIPYSNGLDINDASVNHKSTWISMLNSVWSTPNPTSNLRGASTNSTNSTNSTTLCANITNMTNVTEITNIIDCANMTNITYSDSFDDDEEEALMYLEDEMNKLEEQWENFEDWEEHILEKEKKNEDELSRKKEQNSMQAWNNKFKEKNGVEEDKDDKDVKGTISNNNKLEEEWENFEDWEEHIKEKEKENEDDLKREKEQNSMQAWDNKFKEKEKNEVEVDKNDKDDKGMKTNNNNDNDNGTSALESLIEEGECTPGDYSDLYWEELPMCAMLAAFDLGYTAEIWNEDGVTATDRLAWAKLSNEQKIAAAILGDDEDSWDNGHVPELEGVDCTKPRDYEIYNWSQLPSCVKEAVSVLGYNEKIWNNDGTTEADDYDWIELSSIERLAATIIGYTEQLWDSSRRI